MTAELDRYAAELAAVRARWPDGPEPDVAFARYLADRPSPAPPIDDLYLAWWCSLGVPGGIAAFDAHVGTVLQVAALRFRDLPADELCQQLRVKLFVGTGDTPPKILDYAGKGSLRSWVKVTAVRSFVDITRSTRSQRFEQELDETELLGVSDPEKSSISAELGAILKKAFAAAVAGLTTRQRVFLRHAYVDRHTLEQIANLYSIHRTSVARTLASARQQVIDNTRSAVASEAGIPEDELSTMIRALDSRIELSLSRVLDQPAGPWRF